MTRPGDAARDFAERGLFAGSRVQTSASTPAAPPHACERLFTLKEVEAYCLERWGVKISQVTLRRYVRKGALKVVRSGSRLKRVRVRGAVLVKFFGDEAASNRDQS